MHRDLYPLDPRDPDADESAGQAADAHDREHYGARWSSLLDSANHRACRAEEEAAQVRRLLDATRSRERALAAVVVGLIELAAALHDVMPRNRAGDVIGARLRALVTDARLALRVGGGE